MLPTDADRAAACDLASFIDRSPTPYHAVAHAVSRLAAAGFKPLSEEDQWSLSPGCGYTVARHGTSLVAFVVGHAPPPAAGFRMIGAHTDSPNLRVKPVADVTAEGYRQIGIEVYGGAIYSTWLDRDLSMAGRVALRDSQSVKTVLVDFARPLLRIPNLAIHLNRTVNEGLTLNAQRHMVPIIALEGPGGPPLSEMLVDQLARNGHSASADDVLGWDLCLYDAQAASLAGFATEFIHAGRLDNLASCHAALSALVLSARGGDATRLVVLYDNEEVGSRTAQGAASPFLRSVLARIVPRHLDGPQDLERALARSLFVSADMAHAVHPNYADVHEQAHKPLLGGGPVIKMNSNQSYASDGETAALFSAFCARAGFAPQRFVTRTDLPCGSTIGPITAAALGVRTVDVGNPMLSMHSAREMAGVADVQKMIDVLALVLGS